MDRPICCYKSEIMILTFIKLKYLCVYINNTRTAFESIMIIDNKA